MEDREEDRGDLLAVDGLLRELARGGEGHDEAFVARIMGRRAKSRYRIWWAAAAVLVIGIAGAFLIPWGPARFVEGPVVTAAGQTMSIELADRSRVKVDENTDLVVKPEAQGVKVELNQGQATFEVTKKEAGKQFAVATAHGEIVVHGTKFAASVDEGSLVVRVTEGCVEVRNAHGRALLLPGEHAVLRQDRAPDKKERLFLDPIKVEVPPLSSDPSVKIDYDIVYVRARRAGDQLH